MVRSALFRETTPTIRVRHDQDDASYPRGVSFMHHLRRHAHRVAKAPRSTWRRTFRYQERPSGWPFGPFASRLR